MLGIKIDYDKRIYGYDLLRAFAIFCVVHGHGRHLLSGTILEGFPWFGLPRGVDIFFVISGFLIGFSFLANINKTEGKLGFGKALNFWKRSALRILPNYYLILMLHYLLVSIEILPGSTETFNIIRFFTFTQNLSYPFYDFFWESWSLAVQEWYYLLFPMFLLIFTRYFRVKTVMLFMAIFFILFSLAYRFSISHVEYNYFWWDVSVRKVVASRIDSIFYGVVAAWVRYYYPGIWKKYAIPSFLAGLAVFVVTITIPKTMNTAWTNMIYLSLAPLCISLWFPILDRLKNVKTFVGRIVSHISILSYGLYLFNLLIIQLINKYYVDFMADYATLKYVLYWTVTLAASYVLYIAYENPIASHGNRLLHTTKMMYKRVRESNN